eukprot:9418364-Alexandrium_andersonii.AAC.1
MPPEPIDPPSEEVPAAMPPMPNSIGEVSAPPMAGDAGRDDPNVPWPDERGKAEVIDRQFIPPRRGTSRPPKVPPMIWQTWGARLRDEC